MSRIEHIGGATLYLGDCLEILPTLGKVDAVVTDEPYDIPNGSAFAEGGLKKVKDASGGWNVGRIKWMPEINLNPGATIACFHGRGKEPLGKLESWHRFYWVKTNPPPNPRKVFCSGVEECTLYKEPTGKRVWNGGAITPNYWCGSIVSDRSGHPAEKPLELMKLLIRCISNREQTILDPFMGSGTTGVACAKLGRRFIGIEIDEGYFDIACRRIEEAYRQPDMFIEPPKKAKQENLAL